LQSDWVTQARFTCFLHRAGVGSRPCTLVHIAMLLHKSVEFDSRVRREASALVAAGHRVTVLELASVTPSASGGVARLDGFERRSCLPPAWMRRGLPFHLYRLAFLAWFVGGVARLRPDVVHAHDAAMLLPGVVGARVSGALLVYDSHELATSVPYRERSWAWFVGTIERLVVPRCTAVITVSDGIAERLRRRYRLLDRPTVVRNVTALRLDAHDRTASSGPFRSIEGPGDSRGLRARMEVAAETPLVLHQGAPAPDRGCESLIAAVGRLPGVHLAFLGDPEPGYGSTLRRVADAHAVRDRVSFLPSVPLEELLAQTAQADVGVTLLQDTCENHRLALPNKLFEYIAARVPVVASALPETRRLVEHHGVGWCVPPGDPAALVETLRLALSRRGDPELYERLASAAAELSWDRESKRLTGLYALLAARRPGVALKTVPRRAGECATAESAPAVGTTAPPRSAPTRGGV
jgi:glycosyltransferase involved in cell wall biosynthesis